MGLISDFDVRRLRNAHLLETFVETGTFEGQGLAVGISHFGPANCWTVEANHDLAERARRNFDERIHVVEGCSAEAMPGVLDAIGPAPALFWLDAHLPGLYGTKQGQKLPLVDEVLAIVRHQREHRHDVLIMDDMRLYHPGPFASGPFASGPYGEGIAPGYATIFSILDWTHVVTIDRRREGYLVALPRDLAHPNPRL